MTGPAERGPHPLAAFLSLALGETAGDPARLRAVLAGVRRYQEAPQPPRRELGAVAARRGDIRLRHLAGPADGPPLVLVPSIINGPEILDLADGQSLARYLGARGLRVLLVDWGGMARGERRLSLSGLVSARLLPLLSGIGRPVVLAGYCLGGTLALAAAALGGRAVVARLALIATPWHFEGYGRERRAQAKAAWQALSPVAKGLGALPMPLLNPLFWSLDAAGVVTKFARLGDAPPGDPAIGEFARIEDWAGSGPPLGPAAARQLFEEGFALDAIGRGLWRVAGQRVRPEALSIPILEVGASFDRLVPEGARLRHPLVERITVEAGHVGMVVGRRRHALWQALSNFAESA